MNKFVLLSLKRSGSTYLVSALNNHKDVTCAGEIFKYNEPLRIINPEFSYFNSRNENLNSKFLHFTNRGKLVNRHLDKIYDQNSNSIFGFKLMPRQIQRFPESKNYIIKHKIPAILLIREQYLERMISIKVASNTNIYGSNSEHKKIDKIFIDTTSLIEELEKMESQGNEMKEIAKKTKHLVISYEDLTLNKIEETKQEIVNFLGITSDGLESPLKKMIKKPMSSIIKNYSEVEKVITASKFSYLLN